MPSKVYFTRNIAPESVLKLYEACGLELSGNVAVKLHSGEKGNQNFLPPEFWRPMIEHVHGTVVECNTAYPGSRNTTAAHWQTMRDHGWSDAFTVDIMDEEGPDLQLLIPNGKVIQKNYVGKHLTRYDSLLVLSHFKGHPMGGFGGALKQLSIGVASSHGKAYIHGAGDAKVGFGADHDSFLASMADAASSVAKRFAGKAVYINVMKNLSVDCDCCAVAETPAWRTLASWRRSTRLPSTKPAWTWCTPRRTTRGSSTCWSASRAATASTLSNARRDLASVRASMSGLTSTKCIKIPGWKRNCAA